MQSGNYQSHRGNIESEVFNKVDPRIFYALDNPGSNSISLILSGTVESEASGTNFSVDAGSIQTGTYEIVGVGVNRDFYRDTLDTCEAIQIPFNTPDGLVRVQFDVSFRTTFRSWTYLWNTGSVARILGSWIVDGLGISTDEPYSSDTGIHPGVIGELDYSCSVAGADASVLFVEYIPKNFEYNGTYNALLNNASSESTARFYRYSGSVKEKCFIFDDHKSAAIGGLDAGEIEVPGGLVDREAQTRAYIKSFSGSAKDGKLQTLDLAFMNFRAISASVYVDREEFKITEPIEKVWENLQEGNTDDPQTIYFIPRSMLTTLTSTGSSLYNAVQVEGVKATIPVSGNILFTMDRNTPVRHTRATIYSPFINTVYRTDEYGVITELYSGSVEEGSGD